MPEGWVQRASKEFATLVGPFYQPGEGDPLQCGFFADQRHGNKRGVVHGGMIATAFDVALGNAAWHAAENRPSATVQLNVQFTGALQLGEFAHIRCEIIRTTRSLVFLRGVMSAEGRSIAAADGVWKILNCRGEPYKAS